MVVFKPLVVSVNLVSRSALWPHVVGIASTGSAVGKDGGRSSLPQLSAQSSFKSDCSSLLVQ